MMSLVLHMSGGLSTSACALHVKMSPVISLALPVSESKRKPCACSRSEDKQDASPFAAQASPAQEAARASSPTKPRRAKASRQRSTGSSISSEIEPAPLDGSQGGRASSQLRRRALADQQYDDDPDYQEDEDSESSNDWLNTLLGRPGFVFGAVAAVGSLAAVIALASSSRPQRGWR